MCTVLDSGALGDIVDGVGKEEWVRKVWVDSCRLGSTRHTNETAGFLCGLPCPKEVPSRVGQPTLLLAANVKERRSFSCSCREGDGGSDSGDGGSSGGGDGGGGGSEPTKPVVSQTNKYTIFQQMGNESYINGR
ncbi:hypothetical protein M0802_015242 [Mischocyttarus mexicanus]|nr:hypothetical protein M0802_015242 [Mischocyttarus mexicanus]